MKSFNEYKINQNIPTFFGNLLNIRTEAHVLHLKSKSYSEHEALGEYYNKLLDFTDDLIETYQGQYGIIDLEIKQTKNNNPINLLENFAQDTKNNRKNFNQDDTHLLNIIDEILALTYKTLYKLKNLK